MDPGLLRGIADLGALGLALIAVWGFATGRVSAKGQTDEYRKERDEWKALALSAIERVDALGDVVEELVRRLPPSAK